MAIIVPSGSVPFPGSTQGFILTRGAQGQPVMVPATSNRKGWSRFKSLKATAGPQSFQVLDALILNLDATYDQLTNIPTWEAFALAGVLGWSLCANCEPDKTGKKLFRQINFNRTQLGLAWIFDPALLGPFCDVTAVNIIADEAGTGAPHDAQWVGAGSGGAFYVQASAGAILGNPILAWDTSQVNTVVPGNSLLYQWTAALVKVLDDAIDLRLCFWNPDGMPGISVISELEWNH